MSRVAHTHSPRVLDEVAVAVEAPVALVDGRRGAHHLVMVWPCRSTVPVIAAHYERKRAAGKSKMNAVGHCMSKALSLVCGVWRNGTDLHPDWGSLA